MTRAAGDGNGEPEAAAGFVAAQSPAGAAVPAAGPAAGDADDGEAGTAMAWYGDSVYGTGELREVIRGAGHQAVIKPRPLRPAVEGGFPSMTSPLTPTPARPPAPPGSPGRSARPAG